MRLCGFLGHDCLLWKRSPFDKNTEAESPDNHCRVLLWDGPADTPIMFKTPHQRLFLSSRNFCTRCAFLTIKYSGRWRSLSKPPQETSQGE